MKITLTKDDGSVVEFTEVVPVVVPETVSSTETVVDTSVPTASTDQVAPVETPSTDVVGVVLP